MGLARSFDFGGHERFHHGQGTRPLTDLESARRVFSRGQAARLRLLLLPLPLAFLLSPVLTLQSLHFILLVGFGVLIVWRLGLVMAGALAGWSGRPSLPVTPMALPRYSVLVALYREKRALPGLVSSLSALDYPADKLEVFFLVEADDDETADALRAMPLPGHFHVIEVPDGTPRTKPRALNYGLELASGSKLVIYDAEDRPHRHQLRAAAARFAAGPAALACLQAPLVAYNRGESWLAGQWALEYRVHFQLTVPALARLGLPVPLGGTSNHFDTRILRACGGWDAWNVTEDADLGLRLARDGYQTGVIRPPTLEEAPLSLGAWTAQRSRWLKGHAQTWLVACRTRKHKGFSALAIHLSLAGAVLSACVHGWLAAGIAMALLLPGLELSIADQTILIAGISVNALAALAASLRARTLDLKSVLTQPLYWPLHTFAALRALFGLFHQPHFWAKTEHGVTSIEPLPAPAVFRQAAE